MGEVQFQRIIGFDLDTFTLRCLLDAHMEMLGGQ